MKARAFPRIANECEALIGHLSDLTIRSEQEYDRLNGEALRASSSLRWTIANEEARPMEAGRLMERLSKAFHDAAIRRD